MARGPFGGGAVQVASHQADDGIPGMAGSYSAAAAENHRQSSKKRAGAAGAAAVANTAHNPASGAKGVRRRPPFEAALPSPAVEQPVFPSLDPERRSRVRTIESLIFGGGQQPGGEVEEVAASPPQQAPSGRPTCFEAEPAPARADSGQRRKAAPRLTVDQVAASVSPFQASATSSGAAGSSTPGGSTRQKPSEIPPAPVRAVHDIRLGARGGPSRTAPEHGRKPGAGPMLGPGSASASSLAKAHRLAAGRALALLAAVSQPQPAPSSPKAATVRSVEEPVHQEEPRTVTWQSQQAPQALRGHPLAFQGEVPDHSESPEPLPELLEGEHTRLYLRPEAEYEHYGEPAKSGSFGKVPRFMQITDAKAKPPLAAGRGPQTLRRQSSKEPSSLASSSSAVVRAPSAPPMLSLPDKVVSSTADEAGALSARQQRPDSGGHERSQDEAQALGERRGRSCPGPDSGSGSPVKSRSDWLSQSRSPSPPLVRPGLSWRMANGGPGAVASLRKEIAGIVRRKGPLPPEMRLGMPFSVMDGDNRIPHLDGTQELSFPEFFASLQGAILCMPNRVLAF